MNANHPNRFASGYPPPRATVDNPSCTKLTTNVINPSKI
jgi:hypothetical protein